MNSTIDDKVIERIEKLLSLAGSSNEHEARLATEKAAELLTIHNLTVEQIRGRSEKEYSRNTIHESKTAPGTLKFVLTIIQQFFFVRAIYTRKHEKDFFDRHVGITSISLVGTITNVRIAGQVFTFLMRKFPELWKEFKERNRATTRQRQHYYAGLIIGIEKQLEVIKTKAESSTGLMVVKDAELIKWINEELEIKKEIKPKYSFDEDVSVDDLYAMRRGVTDGKELHIQRGIENAAANMKNQLTAGSGSKL